MTCVAFFVGIERQKKLVREGQVDTVDGDESSEDAFVLAIV